MLCFYFWSRLLDFIASWVKFYQLPLLQENNNLTPTKTDAILPLSPQIIIDLFGLLERCLPQIIRKPIFPNTQQEYLILSLFSHCLYSNLEHVCIQAADNHIIFLRKADTIPSILFLHYYTRIITYSYKSS